MSDLTKQFSSAELRRLAAQTGSGFISEALHYAAEVNTRSVAQAKRIAELEADNARLRVDGDRYHHIRKHTIGERVNMGQWFSFPFIKPVGNIMQGSVAQHLDDAIDAARKEQS